MAIKEIKARVAHMHDVESNWDKCPSFIPEAGEVIVYDADGIFNYPRFKIGDGRTPVVSLPFSVDASLERYFNNRDSNTGFVDAGRITEYSK